MMRQHKLARTSGAFKIVERSLPVFLTEANKEGGL
jgi:hypothetical protein